MSPQGLVEAAVSCQADHDARRAAGTNRFDPTPAREAAVKIGAALGVSEYRVLNDLHLRGRLVEWSPSIWQRCRAARYRRLKFAQKTFEPSFGEAFQKRRVWVRVEDNGTAALGVTGAAHDLQACSYRITLIAKKRCQQPDEDRTLAQMEADTVLDLLPTTTR